MTIDPKLYEQFFPFSTIRDEQRQAIEFALEAFDGGKRFVILEMGTGCGKSATGVAIARAMHARNVGTGAYVLTTQKVLQDQYDRDFGLKSRRGLLRSIKSSSNYQCGSKVGHTCAEIRRITGNSHLAAVAARSNEFKHCKTSCPYVLDKKGFVAASVSVTNFSYFLAETMYAGQLMPRDLLIIDECHNVEQELGRFIEITFSERFAKDVLGCRGPNRDASPAVIHAWIAGQYKQALQAKIADTEAAIKRQIDQNVSELGELGRQIELLDKHICKLNRFLEEYSANGWVMNVSFGVAGNVLRKFEFKPVDVSHYSEESLFRFGAKVLLMSATIVDRDVFCRTVGIPLDQAAFLRIPSPFPVENRQVHFMPIGSMSKANIENTLPKMAEAVSMLMNEHRNEKGIIHCVNYRIARYLRETIGGDRLLLHDATNRDETLKLHEKSSQPTVLVSPSMMEGIDLAGDLSRFQVIVKVPFPFLGDEVVKRRMDANPRWYAYQTARAVMQALGRSVRSESDHAVSYILDRDWERFYYSNSSMFPNEFKEAVN